MKYSLLFTNSLKQDFSSPVLCACAQCGNIQYVLGLTPYNVLEIHYNVAIITVHETWIVYI